MWRYHICAATVFSLNELAHECKKSTSDWRTSLKNAFAQDSVSVVNQHYQNFRFEIPTTSGSQWISISRSSQTNKTTSWGKSKLFKNFSEVVFFSFSPVPRTYMELGGGGRVKKWFQGRSWRVAVINVPLGRAFATKKKKKKKTPVRLIASNLTLA